MQEAISIKEQDSSFEQLQRSWINFPLNAVWHKYLNQGSNDYFGFHGQREVRDLKSKNEVLKNKDRYTKGKACIIKTGWDINCYR